MKPLSGTAYALRALVDLVLHEGTGPVTVGTIAKRQQIPARYLEQLFHRLRRQGIVVAERGPRGGYRLNRPPKEVTVSAIFNCLDTPQGGLSPEATVPQGIETDPTAAVWQQVEAAVQTTLEATTLEDLASQVREKSPTPFDHRFTFHI